MFRRIFARRISKQASFEIDPEDVFLDARNIPTFNVDQLEGHLEKPLPMYMSYVFLIGCIALFLAFSGRLFSEKSNEDETVLLIVGSEVDGVSKYWLDQADKVLTIPMIGEKESFNVTIAFGIALYELARE
jgi:hypothetical protein